MTESEWGARPPLPGQASPPPMPHQSDSDLACAACGHDDPHTWGDGYCIEPVGPCDCGDPRYQRLCMCSVLADDSDDEPSISVGAESPK